ncbi:MAG: DEAD/DEAH box helicase, partial [Mariprofundaceae bacterium]
FDSPEYTFRLEHDDYWPEWMLYEIPELEAKGFAVEVAEDFAFRVEEATAWDLSLGQDDLTLPGNLMGQASFMVSLDGGDEIDLIDALARWVGEKPEILKSESLARLKEKANVPLPLPNGRLLPVPGEMVASILHFMMDVFTSGGRGEVQLSAPQMLALEESLGQSVVPVRIQSSVWLKEMRQLVDIGNIPVCDVPHSLQAELRDYQREGLNWLQFLRQTGLGGILADDMGLGKTVQALAHILKEKEGGRLQLPVLVIAPTSLMHNWRREAEKFTPGLSVLVLYGPNRARHFGKLMTFDLVLTTYPLLGRDFEVLEAQDWHSLILDEAQYIKNPRAKVAKLVRRLNTENKLCMTGTPMENHLGELWAQFDFLMPGYLHDMRTFSKQFRKPIEIQGDIARQDALNVRLRPFLLRRKKDEVALELPPKMEMVRSIEMEGAQRQLYESVRLAMQKRVRAAVVSMGAAKSQIVVLDALLKMRQVCCDPRLVDGLTGAVPESAKLGMLMEMLPEMIDEGRRVLLFSQFTSMLKLIEVEVSRKNIAYVKMTGQTQDRSAPIESFQEKKVPLFLISLRAGGVGLNLTAADTVIHYDPWWNPAVEAQATDRAHRIGQDKSVFVYKLITEGSVEEKILELQERKRELADAIHQKGAAKRPLWSSEELDALFAPLS